MKYNQILSNFSHLLKKTNCYNTTLCCQWGHQSWHENIRFSVGVRLRVCTSYIYYRSRLDFALQQRQMGTKHPNSPAFSAVCSSTHQRKHQSCPSLAFVWGIHRWAVDSPHKRPVTRKTVPFDDVIMLYQRYSHLGCKVLWTVLKTKKKYEYIYKWIFDIKFMIIYRVNCILTGQSGIINVLAPLG